MFMKMTLKMQSVQYIVNCMFPALLVEFIEFPTLCFASLTAKIFRRQNFEMIFAKSGIGGFFFQFTL